MSIELSGLIPKEVTEKWEEAKKAEFMDRRKKRRSTYTQTNADLFRPLFDSVINEGKEKHLPYSAFRGLSPQTVYVKCCDALKYLTENEKDAKKLSGYILLKGTYKITPEVEGVTIRRKKGGTQIDIISMIRNASEPIAASVTVAQPHQVPTIVEYEDGEIAEDNVPVKKIKNWKDTVEEFVNDMTNKDEHVEITFEGILSDSEKNWIASIFSGVPNVDYLISGNKLQMMKEKI